MKITELTQKTHSEQLSEDRTKLDEIAWAPITAAAGAGLSYYDLGSRFGYNPLNWTKDQWKTAGAEIAADAALGATGVGLASVANKARKVGTRAYRNRAAARAQTKADKAQDKANDPNKGPLGRRLHTQQKADTAQGKANDAAARAAAAAIPAAKKGIIGQAAKAVGLGAIGNAASNELLGKPIVAPSDIPVLGKTASGKPQPNPNRIDRAATDIGNATKPPVTPQSLADQARKLRGY
jgi:hypothetical protein